MEQTMIKVTINGETREYPNSIKKTFLPVKRKGYFRGQNRVSGDPCD